jgi:hypothetical protein
MIAVVLFVVDCKKSATDTEKPPSAPDARHSPQATPTPSAPAQPKGILMSDIFIKEESLSYNGFKIATIAKTLKSKSQELSYAQTLSYAVITKNGKVVAKIGGLMDHPLAAIDIGLFPLLGSKTKQLIISQTVPRGGRHWIVELASNPRVLFNSWDYEVGREEVWAVDIEGDGVHEVNFFVTSFYGAFNQLSVAHTPLPIVVFRYDKQAGRYLPANHRYRDYLLGGIEAEINNLPTEISPLPSSAGELYLARRLDVLLRLLYAGKEKEGWEFFDKAYTLPDADKIKAIVKEELRKAPAYKFIRKRSST